MPPREIGDKPIIMSSTDFYFLVCDGMLQRRLNEVELIAITERVVAAYFAVILDDEDIIQIDEGAFPFSRLSYPNREMRISHAFQ